jgi:hypothetical protein
MHPHVMDIFYIDINFKWRSPNCTKIQYAFVVSRFL